MGITVNYRRISPEKFAELQGNPKLAEEFFNGEDSSSTAQIDRLMQAQAQNERELMQQISTQVREALYRDKASVYADNLDTTKTQLSIEKEWQAIHYLLTGEIAFDETQAEPPLSNVVLGGRPTKFKASYGYVRYLTPDEVKEIALALNQVSREELRTRFDSGNAKIYAQEEQWDEESWMFLMNVQDDLVRFFNEAAANNQVILISSD
ncbi:YfbM family protein [Kamptonema sp. UHCC 0994]|nr:YfbM family protein [Kamptonema sp. UHCC 0994]